MQKNYIYLKNFKKLEKFFSSKKRKGENPQKIDFFCEDQCHLIHIVVVKSVIVIHIHGGQFFLQETVKISVVNVGI